MHPTTRAALFGAAVAVVVAAISLLDPTFFGAEWLLRDAFTRRIASSRKPDPRIILVTVGDESIRTLEQLNFGRPPYPRSVYALAIDELRRAGAAVIAFDVLFSEEDAAHPEDDRTFAQAVAGAPVILAADTRSGVAPVRPDIVPKLWKVQGARATWALSPPHPAFSGAPGIGTIRLATSKRSDAAHSCVMVDCVADNLAVPSLALETARAYLHLPREATHLDTAWKVGDLEVPRARDGGMAIRWNGATADGHARKPSDIVYAHYELQSIVIAALAHDDPSLGIDPARIAELERAFKGKIVLVGYTAAGLYDLRATPLSPIAPGLEIHANAIDNLINRDFAREAPHGIALLVIVIVAILLAAALQPIRSQLASAAVAIMALALSLLVSYALLAGGIIVPGAAASVALALTYVTITVSKFVAEQEQSAMLKTTFGRYVSPQILDHILAHPELLRLGGDRRELTILFSDIRGFTSISEAAEPEQVVEMLNEYLTEMVDILLRHGGTLDKFIGDAVMGFWNAPAADPDHAVHAVNCAIEMVRATAALRERWEKEGKASIRIGVGVNTGEAVVGNIGAEKVYSYTVIGDAVNLASRLEGKNKDYGTEVIVSEFTRARIGDAFDLVYLDDVKVKGKEHAVKIYQVRT